MAGSDALRADADKRSGADAADLARALQTDLQRALARLRDPQVGWLLVTAAVSLSAWVVAGR